MKKNIIRIIDSIIYVLCFLFILSSFFKCLSYTFVDVYIKRHNNVLICVWIAGSLVAILFTRPLYRWILHLRCL